MTVDQSAKWVTFGGSRLGGGSRSADSADVMLWVGTNPLVSFDFQFDLQHPVRRLQDTGARPQDRRHRPEMHGNCAAQTFLQPLPGEDVTVRAC
jgi:hypothetical protein